MTEEQSRWQLDDIMALFDGLFAKRFNTRLIKGGDEPLYLPADTQTPYHRVIFARGFYASALHEISHWCIAGPARRLQEDYGYWYLPDGRNAEQQQAFEQAEIAPQALELLLTRACERRFNVSVDNLGGDVEVDREQFASKVAARAQRYEEQGLPLRAEALSVALGAFYQRHLPMAQALERGLEVLSSEVAHAD